jgi:adenosine kinase
MRIITAGAVANDHLMTFPGRFADQLLAGSLERVSLSFLVDDLNVYPGGTGANVAYAAGLLGVRPTFVAAVGSDFAGAGRTWLDDHGVDTRFLRVSTTRHTARFTNTSDTQGAQIGSFYPGAMVEASEIRLGPIVAELGGVDVVLLSPDDPQAMLGYADECRSAGWRFWADIGQQIARFDAEEVTRFVTGAAYLFTNSYEAELVEHRTGWTVDEALSRVGTWIVTHGPEPIEIRRSGAEPVRVPIVRADRAVDPTGAGDAFRGGFLAGHSWGLADERAAQVGAAIAAFSVESVGPQEYQLTIPSLVDRIRATYGDAAADEIAKAATDAS